MNKTVRYAIVGTSRIASMFAEGAVGAAPALEICAVYSRSPDTGYAFSEQHGGGLAIYTDLTSLAQTEDIDAVYIASPNSLHAEQSKLMLEHGKHVLCEKPATVSPEQIDELLALAQRGDLIYLEGMLSTHQPERAVLKEAIAGIGQIREAHLKYSQLSSRYTALARGELPNIFNPALAGGALMDLGCYCVNAAADLFGAPQSLEAHAVMLDSGADASGAALLGYADKTITLGYSKTGQGTAPSEIIGDNGSVTVDLISLYGGIRLHRGGMTQELAGLVDHVRAMGHEALDFYRYITDTSAKAQQYPAMAEQMRLSAQILFDIRQNSGIRFPFE